MATDGQRIVRGACPLDCPDTCSWEVTVENGRAVNLHGTRDHPFTQGNLCVKVNRYLEHTQAPDRLLYPMRRVGKKGAGEFERIAWDEALDEIGTRFKDVIDSHGGEAIWPFFGTGNMGFLQGMWGSGFRLWNALGASQHQVTICAVAGVAGTTLTLGQATGMDPEDLRHSKLIILWGYNPLTTATTPGASSRKRAAMGPISSPSIPSAHAQPLRRMSISPYCPERMPPSPSACSTLSSPWAPRIRNIWPGIRKTGQRSANESSSTHRNESRK